MVALAGDIHNNWAGELKKNFLDEKSATLGVEFVGTSVSTDGDGYDINENFKRRIVKQPYVKFFNNQRGYVRNVVTSIAGKRTSRCSTRSPCRTAA